MADRLPDVLVDETMESQTLEDGVSGERQYIVKGTDEPSEVIRQVYGKAPVTWEGLRRQPARISPMFVIDDAPDLCMWGVVVPYAAGQRSTPAKTGETVRSFSTGSGTVHITNSKATVWAKSRYLPLEDIKAKYGGAIGVTKDGVEGCDIVAPEPEIVLTKYVPWASFTTAYEETLEALHGKVNNATFQGRAAGRVLFLGAEAQARGHQDYEVTYRFRVGKHIVSGDNISIGTITNIEKEAHQYLWIYYSDYVDPTTNCLAKRPEEVFVEKVYDAADFSLLGLT